MDVQDLDHPESRRRTHTPVAGTIEVRQCAETPDISAERTIGLERVVDLARAWVPGEAEDLEEWLGDNVEQLDELGDRAEHVEQGEAGKAHFSRGCIRH
jgi:hypothetical protein